jgi:hypothetical protein
MHASDSWIPGDDQYEDYSRQVDMDGAFAAWLRKVDIYAERFLGMSFFEVENCWDPVQYYIEGCRPMGFVRHVMIPSLVCDMGCDFVEELVAERVLWGNLKDGRR